MAVSRLADSAGGAIVAAVMMAWLGILPTGRVRGHLRLGCRDSLAFMLSSAN